MGAVIKLGAGGQKTGAKVGVFARSWRSWNSGLKRPNFNRAQKIDPQADFYDRHGFRKEMI